MRVGLTIIFLLVTQFLIAQYSWTDAEVHLKNGKVLNGQAAITMMSNAINLKKEKLSFRQNKKSKKSRYTPEEVDYVIFTIKYEERVGKKKIEKTRKEKYISVYLNNKQSRMGFVQLIVDGPLRLVGRTVTVNNGSGWTYTPSPHPGGGTNAHFNPIWYDHNQIMLLREGKKPEIFNQISLTKSFKKRAMDYFKDCPDLRLKIENKTYKKEDLEAIVSYYNSQCK